MAVNEGCQESGDEIGVDSFDTTVTENEIGDVEI